MHRRAGDVTAASDDVVAGEHVNDELLIGCGGLRDGDVTGQVRGAVVGSALEAERTVYAAAALHAVPDVTQRDLLPTHTHTRTHARARRFTDCVECEDLNIQNTACRQSE